LGVEALRSAGERELLTLAARPDDDYAQEMAIRALGLLGVDAARDVIKTRTSGRRGSVKRAAAEAPAQAERRRLCAITIDLMKPPPRTRGIPVVRSSTKSTGLRKSAIELAGESHNVAFVPALIALLPVAVGTARRRPRPLAASESRPGILSARTRLQPFGC